MPPGAEATGHFRENTAILSLAGGGLDAENGRWFHENSMSRRSPSKPAALPRREAAPDRAGEQEEPGKEERWRRRRERKGRSRMREKRDGERESIGWEGHRCFLGLGREVSRAIDHAARELALARRACMDAPQDGGKRADFRRGSEFSTAFGDGAVKVECLEGI
jgi:hypothetical protein